MQLISGQFNFFAPLLRKTSIFEGNKTGSKASFFKNHHSAWEGCSFLLRTLGFTTLLWPPQTGVGGSGKATLEAKLEDLGAILGGLGTKLGVLGLTWEHLGANLGGLGANLAVLEATLQDLMDLTKTQKNHRFLLFFFFV